ncbi:hypothetical protein K438DRAFT_1761939 [Mycena galopus ATCC 62051]|nr:hypothetical protein K438DRAFT_1761939 [Mycena galopus ATCC 62051]
MYPEADTFLDETQLYSGKRLLSFQGYDYPPLVDDAFQWRLPDSGSRFGRERRYDGHLGKFDPTVTPQYYDKKRPWLAFIPSASQLTAFDLSARAEFVPIIRAWEVDSERPYRGRLREEFVQDLDEANRTAQSMILSIGMRTYRERMDLWNNRSIMPLRADFDELRKRWILEKQAWYTMAELWLYYRSRDRDLLAVQILPAREEFLGVWIHGITEEDLKFFLGQARAPCYLVHELVDGEVPGKLTMEDFVQGTAVAALVELRNSEYDYIALRLNGGVHMLRDASLPLPGIAFRPAPERLLSGSQNQWGPLVQEGRTARSESPDGVSIPGSDEDEELLAEEEITVVADPEWSSTPRAMILGSEVTIPLADTILTSLLKFTVPDSFAMEGMTAWLKSATDRTQGGRWLRMSRMEWRPRAHYYIEFDTVDTALRVKGLVNASDGTIRLVEFARQDEFDAVLEKHPVSLLDAAPRATHGGNRHPPLLDPRLVAPDTKTPLPRLQGATIVVLGHPSRVNDLKLHLCVVVRLRTPLVVPAAPRVGGLPTRDLLLSASEEDLEVAPDRLGDEGGTRPGAVAHIVVLQVRTTYGGGSHRSPSPLRWDSRVGTTERGIAPAPIEDDPPAALLDRLEQPPEHPSSPPYQESTLFRRMGVSLEERMGHHAPMDGMTEETDATSKVKRRRGRPNKAARDRLDAERRKHGGAL